MESVFFSSQRPPQIHLLTSSLPNNRYRKLPVLSLQVSGLSLQVFRFVIANCRFVIARCAAQQANCQGWALPADTCFFTFVLWFSFAQILGKWFDPNSFGFCRCRRFYQAPTERDRSWSSRSRTFLVTSTVLDDATPGISVRQSTMRIRRVACNIKGERAGGEFLGLSGFACHKSKSS